MKIFTKKGIVHKIIIALVIVILLFQFCMPPMVQADSSEIKDALIDIGKDALKGAAHMVAAAGDIVMSALNNWMLRNSWIWNCNDFTGSIWQWIMV